MRLHNTLSRQKDEFEPTDPKRVTMYACGPTVYNYAHIGNARPAVAFDVLYRVLLNRFGKDHVVYARNITDVDDKIIDAAKSRNVDISEITEKFTQIYREDMGALQVLEPTIEPKVTGTMNEIIAMVGNLVERGHAYLSEGHVLFDVTSYDDYGKLSGHSLEDLHAGKRVEVADYKKNAADFVLWKPSNEDQIGWDSPWGRGRPGWHIECSAMIETHLGETIDIHAGGIDLIFPHHENEIAQSVCAHGGKTYARYWTHNGFLTLNGKKASKSDIFGSADNTIDEQEKTERLFLVHRLRDYVPGEALRLALLSAHYRQPLEWSPLTIEESLGNLDRLYKGLEKLDGVEIDNDAPAPQTVVDALEDDLNSPKALAEIFNLLKQAHAAGTDEEKRATKTALVKGGWLLGILQDCPFEWCNKRKKDCSSVDGNRVEQLIKDRAQARKDKDWGAADRIRDEIAAMGVVLIDSPAGTTWEVK